MSRQAIHAVSDQQDRDTNDSGPLVGARKTIAVCLVLVALGALVNWVVFSTEPTAKRESSVRQSASLVDVVQGEFGSFNPVIEAMGTVRPAQEIALRAQVGGNVLALGAGFSPGGFVARNDLLLEIDDADYQIALQQANSALDQAIAAQEIEQGEQISAQEQYRQMGRDLPLERQALILREPQSRVAVALVESARANVRQAELNLARTKLTAPFDAHVVSRQVNTGSYVTPGADLGRLVGLNTYWIETTVPVSQLQWLKIPTGDGESGSAVMIRNRQAWPDNTWRAGRVFRLIGELEGNTRLARVLIAVDDPLARNIASGQPRLMIGEYVANRIQGRQIKDVVRIPRGYVRENETLWLFVDEKLAIRPVDIVFQDDQFAYVSGGLSQDDLVVTTRLSTVKEGLRLRVDSK